MEPRRREELMCRLCGEKKPSNRMKANVKDSNIEHKLKVCCRWHLYESYEHLPEHICNVCLKSLEESWTFAESVASVQHKFVESPIKIEPIYLEPEMALPTEDKATEDVKHIEISCEPIDFGPDNDYDYSQDLSDIDNTEFGDIELTEKSETKSDDKSELPFTQQTSSTPHDFDMLKVLLDSDKSADGTVKMEKVLKLKLENWSKLSFPCWICNLSYSDSGSLAEHIGATHPGSEQRIMCSFCPTKVIFSRKTTLYDHVRKHHLPHLKYCCVKCNVFYWDLNLLKKHVQFHPKPRRSLYFLCEMCGVEFDSSTKLRQHSRIHFPVTRQRSFECYMCKVSFKCKKSLVHHMPHSSYEKITYECKECLLKFSRPYALRRHSPIHSGGFPHSCDYCGKPFRTKANLKVHVRIHTGERPYGCKLCDYRSIDGPNLRKHMKQRHSSHTTVTTSQPFSNSTQFYSYSTKSTEPQMQTIHSSMSTI